METNIKGKRTNVGTKRSNKSDTKDITSKFRKQSFLNFVNKAQKTNVRQFTEQKSGKRMNETNEEHNHKQKKSLMKSMMNTKNNEQRTENGNNKQPHIGNKGNHFQTQ